MLKIRLARTGRKKRAHYRVVVSDSRRTPGAGHVTQLGYYDPHAKQLVLDAAKTQHYIDNGAQMSSRMVKLLQNEQDITLPEWAYRNLVTKPERQTEVESTAEESDESSADTDSKPSEPTSADESDDTSTTSDENDQAETESKTEAAT